MNQEAQANIGRAVQELINQKKVDLVALEGAFKPIDLTPFRTFSNQDTIRKVADYLLRENRISGPIHTAFTSPNPIPLFLGVDDPRHYRANIEAYRASAARMEKYKKWLRKEEQKLREKRGEVFASELLDFDNHIQAYRDGTVKLGEHVQFLSSHTTEIPANCTLFLEALNLEASLDFPQLDAERSRLLEKLLRKLSTEETSSLVGTSVAYRAGHLNPSDFYQTLNDLCQKKGLPLDQFPRMKAYLQYVLWSDRIDAEKLFDELKFVEERAYAPLVRTAEEKELVDLSKRLYLVGKLLDFALTPEEWREYSSSREGGDDDLGSFESFYHEAELRDEKMAENLISSFPRKRESRPQTQKKVDDLDPRFRGDDGTLVVLVTGGFHSQGIDQRLADAGYTVVTFVPKITKVEDANGTGYLGVFTQEKTPLEKLFEGEKLFLAHPPMPLNEAAVKLLTCQAAAGNKSGDYLSSLRHFNLRYWWGSVVEATSRRVVTRVFRLVKGQIESIIITMNFDDRGEIESVVLSEGLLSILVGSFLGFAAHYGFHLPLFTSILISVTSAVLVLTLGLMKIKPNGGLQLGLVSAALELAPALSPYYWMKETQIAVSKKRNGRDRPSPSHQMEPHVVEDPGFYGIDIKQSLKDNRQRLLQMQAHCREQLVLLFREIWRQFMVELGDRPLSPILLQGIFDQNKQKIFAFQQEFRRATSGLDLLSDASDAHLAFAGMYSSETPDCGVCGTTANCLMEALVSQGFDKRLDAQIEDKDSRAERSGKAVGHSYLVLNASGHSSRQIIVDAAAQAVLEDAVEQIVVENRFSYTGRYGISLAKNRRDRLDRQTKIAGLYPKLRADILARLPRRIGESNPVPENFEDLGLKPIPDQVLRDCYTFPTQEYSLRALPPGVRLSQDTFADLRLVVEEMIDNAIDEIVDHSSPRLTLREALQFVKGYSGYRWDEKGGTLMFAIENPGEIDLKKFKRKLPDAIARLKKLKADLMAAPEGAVVSHQGLKLGSNDLPEIQKTLEMTEQIAGKSEASLGDFRNLVVRRFFTTKTDHDGLIGRVGIGLSHVSKYSFGLKVFSGQGRTIFLVEAPLASEEGNRSNPTFPAVAIAIVLSLLALTGAGVGVSAGAAGVVLLSGANAFTIFHNLFLLSSLVVPLFNVAPIVLATLASLTAVPLHLGALAAFFSGPAGAIFALIGAGALAGMAKAANKKEEASGPSEQDHQIRDSILKMHKDLWNKPDKTHETGGKAVVVVPLAFLDKKGNLREKLEPKYTITTDPSEPYAASEIYASELALYLSNTVRVAECLLKGVGLSWPKDRLIDLSSLSNLESSRLDEPLPLEPLKKLKLKPKKWKELGLDLEKKGLRYRDVLPLFLENTRLDQFLLSVLEVKSNTLKDLPLRADLHEVFNSKILTQRNLWNKGQLLSDGQIRTLNRAHLRAKIPSVFAMTFGDLEFLVLDTAERQLRTGDEKYLTRYEIREAFRGMKSKTLTYNQKTVLANLLFLTHVNYFKKLFDTLPYSRDSFENVQQQMYLFFMKNIIPNYDETEGFALTTYLTRAVRFSFQREMFPDDVVIKHHAVVHFSPNSFDDEALTAPDKLTEDSIVAPEETNREEEELIQNLLPKLNKREREIIALRYGLGGGSKDGLTLKSLGERLRLSKGRIRQLEQRALGKLRAMHKPPAANPAVNSSKEYSFIPILHIPLLLLSLVVPLFAAAPIVLATLATLTVVPLRLGTLAVAISLALPISIGIGGASVWLAALAAGTFMGMARGKIQNRTGFYWGDKMRELANIFPLALTEARNGGIRSPRMKAILLFIYYTMAGVVVPRYALRARFARLYLVINDPRHFAPVKYRALLTTKWGAVKLLVNGDNVMLDPEYFEIHPAEPCNLNCEFCRGLLRDVPEKQQMMSHDHLMELIEGIHRMNPDAFLRIAGNIGEPLLHRSIAEAFTRANALGLKWGLVTNGLLLQKPAVMEELLKAKFVHISIDAGSDETYQSLKKGRPGDYEKVLRHIRELVERKRAGGARVHITASLLLQAENYQEIPELSRRLKHIGVDSFHIKMQHYVPRKIMTPAQIKQAYQIARRAQKTDTDDATHVFLVQGEEEALLNVKGVRQPIDFGLCAVHALGLTSLWDPRGNGQPCGEYYGRTLDEFGNLSQGSLADLLRSEGRRRMLQGDPRQHCKQCSPTDEFVNRFVDFLKEAQKYDPHFMAWAERVFVSAKSGTGSQVDTNKDKPILHTIDPSFLIGLSLALAFAASSPVAQSIGIFLFLVSAIVIGLVFWKIQQAQNTAKAIDEAIQDFKCLLSGNNPIHGNTDPLSRLYALSKWWKQAHVFVIALMIVEHADQIGDPEIGPAREANFLLLLSQLLPKLADPGFSKDLLHRIASQLDGEIRLRGVLMRAWNRRLTHLEQTYLAFYFPRLTGAEEISNAEKWNSKLIKPPDVWLTNAVALPVLLLGAGGAAVTALVALTAVPVQLGALATLITGISAVVLTATADAPTISSQFQARGTARSKLIPYDEDTAQAVNGSDIFGNDHPVRIEIGFGKADLLLEEAKRHPEINHVGFELPDESLIPPPIFDSLISLPNVRIVLGDADKTLPALVPNGSIDEILVVLPFVRGGFDWSLYPIMQEKLREGGELVVVTEQKDLAKWLERNLKDRCDIRLLGAFTRTQQADINQAARRDVTGTAFYDHLVHRGEWLYVVRAARRMKSADKSSKRYRFSSGHLCSLGVGPAGAWGFESRTNRGSFGWLVGGGGPCDWNWSDRGRIASAGVGPGRRAHTSFADSSQESGGG